jgi:hypothetical protein
VVLNSKLQKFVPFDLFLKSPLFPLFQRRERFTPAGIVIAMGRLMGLQASLCSPLLKGDRGILTVADSQAYRNINYIIFNIQYSMYWYSAIIQYSFAA